MEARQSQDELRERVAQLSSQNKKLLHRLDRLQFVYSAEDRSVRFFEEADLATLRRQSTAVPSGPHRTSMASSSRDSFPVAGNRRDFEVILESSRVYSRNRSGELDAEIDSSAVRTGGWSMLSELTLNDISIYAVFRLPFTLEDMDESHEEQVGGPLVPKSSRPIHSYDELTDNGAKQQPTVLTTASEPVSSPSYLGAVATTSTLQDTAVPARATMQGLRPCAATSTMFLHAEDTSVVCSRHSSSRSDRIMLGHVATIELLAVSDEDFGGSAASSDATPTVGFDSSRVVTSDAGGVVIVWMARSGDQVAYFRSEERLTTVAWMRNDNIAFGMLFPAFQLGTPFSFSWRSGGPD